MWPLSKFCVRKPGLAARIRGAVPLLLIVLTGCGGGPALVGVSGTLTHKGKPVANALINFLPENGRPSSGITDEDGHFTLNYDPEHDGTVVGKHIVSVKSRPVRPKTAKEQEAAISGRKMPMSKDMQDFFEKYSPQNSKYEVVIDKKTPELKLELD